VSLVDTRNNKRESRVYLKPVQTVTAGLPFGGLRLAVCREVDLGVQATSADHATAPQDVQEALRHALSFFSS
jgi:hypothetical protein